MACFIFTLQCPAAQYAALTNTATANDCHKGGYVFVAVCQFVCLCVSRVISDARADNFLHEQHTESYHHVHHYCDSKRTVHTWCCWSVTFPTRAVSHRTWETSRPNRRPVAMSRCTLCLKKTSPFLLLRKLG